MFLLLLNIKFIFVFSNHEKKKKYLPFLLDKKLLIFWFLKGFLLTIFYFNGMHAQKTNPSSSITVLVRPLLCEEHQQCYQHTAVSLVKNMFTTSLFLR